MIELTESPKGISQRDKGVQAKDMNRRNILKNAAGAAAITSLLKLTPQKLDAQGRPAQPPKRVNTNSAPSNLKITDMRAITIASNYDYPIIRIDTNQGVYGLGEVRDAGGKDNALIVLPQLEMERAFHR